MTWTDVVDGYCERTDAGYWSEPVNAVSNLAFVVAAVIAWRMARAAEDRPAQLLAVTAGCVGVGSYLFHTHATRWALQADVWPIRVFVLLYVGLAVVRFLGTPRRVGAAAAAGFAAATAVAIAAGGALDLTLNGSIGYATVPAGLALMSALVARRDRATAVGLLAGAAVFLVSLALRTVDRELCTAVPLGTHFAWHLLNGVVAGLMIVVFVRHGRTAGPARADDRAFTRRG